MDLDIQFHINKRTGETQRVIDRGVSQLNSMLESVVFTVGPQLLDLVIYLIYFSVELTPLLAVIVLISFAIYIPTTVTLSNYRSKFRRRMNTKDNQRSAVAVDALLNYETVKYFTNEKFELGHYSTCIEEYLSA